MKFIALPALLCLGSLCLCSCKSVTYDVRRLDQPILLNNNPCLAGTAAARVEVANLDRYSATVSDVDMVASAGNTTTTSRAVVKGAQVNAFNKIGGQQDRVIRGLSFDAECAGINGLFILINKISVQASGDVAQVKCPAPTGTHPTPGGALQ